MYGISINPGNAQDIFKELSKKAKKTKTINGVVIPKEDFKLIKKLTSKPKKLVAYGWALKLVNKNEPPFIFSVETYGESGSWSKSKSAKYMTLKQKDDKDYKPIMVKITEI